MLGLQLPPWVPINISTMKTAVLIHGQPRFTRCTTELFAKFPGHEQVDWFMYLWEKTIPDPRGWQLVAPVWQDITQEFVSEQWTNRLPSNHVIQSCVVVPTDVVEVPEFTEVSVETLVVGSYLQFWTLHQCDLLRRAHEQAHGEYDVVIKIRPDCRMAPDFSAERIYTQVTSAAPLTIWTSKLNRWGHKGQINDQFALGSSAAMIAYSDCVLHIQQYHDAGVRFHPETILAHHVAQQQLTDCSDEYTIELRPYARQHNDCMIDDFADWDTIL